MIILFYGANIQLFFILYNFLTNIFLANVFSLLSACWCGFAPVLSEG